MVLVQRIVDLLTTVLASRNRCVPQFAVSTLQDFYSVFILLGHVHIVELVLLTVSAVAAVRADHLGCVAPLHTVVDLLPNVPIPAAVPVDVPHLIALQFGNYNAVFNDLPVEVVTRLLLVVSDFVPAFEPVFLVLKSNLSTDPVNERAPKGVQNFVLMRLVSDQSAVRELHPLSALDDQIYAVHVGFGRVGAVTPPFVNAVGSHLAHVAHWWVVRDLLHEDFGAIGALTLISLPQHWVQRLVKPVTRVQET